MRYLRSPQNKDMNYSCFNSVVQKEKRYSKYVIITTLFKKFTFFPLCIFFTVLTSTDKNQEHDDNLPLPVCST